MSAKGRVRNEFKTVNITRGGRVEVIGLKPEQFTQLAHCTGRGARMVKGGNEKALGVLSRLGLVRFEFRNEGDWTQAYALLTAAGNEALAQEPRGHDVTVQ